MRRNIISALLICGSIAGAQAQITEFDAMNAVKTDITGTARYMGMAGAMGALGGDVSAIKDNPAGLGVYRSSELTTTGNFITRGASSAWNGMSFDESDFKFAFDNVGLVMAFPTWSGRNGGKGLLQSNWSFSYNRLKNFNRQMTVGADGLGTSFTDFMAGFTNGLTPYDLTLVDNESEYYDPYENVNIPWLSTMAYETGLIKNVLVKDPNDPSGNTSLETDQWVSALQDGEKVNSRYYLKEVGSISEYAISWGGNFSNMIYVGATVNFQSINYSMQSNYIEEFGQNEGFELTNIVSTSGLGINGNFGIIYRPTDFLRFGVAYKTPMRYRLTTYNNGDMTSNLLTDKGMSTFSSKPLNENKYDYEVYTPGEVTASAAWIIGKKAIVSADFNYTNYRNIKMYDAVDGNRYYEEDNAAIKSTFGNGMEFNVGAEYRITDHFSVRAGFAAETAAMTSEAAKYPHLNTARTDMEYFRHRGTNYITAGLGYRGDYLYFDAAFVNRNLTEDFVPYNTINNNPATVKTHDYNVVATIGFKF